MLAAFKERLLLGIQVLINGLGKCRVARQRRVRAHNLLGVLPGPGNDVLVLQDTEQLQRGPATGLRGAEDVALAAQLQVLLG